MMQPKYLYFVLVGLLGLTIVSAVAGFWLSHQSLNQRIMDLEKLNGDLAFANASLDDLRQLEADYQEIRPLAEQVEAVLPAEKQQAEVVAQIAAIVGSHGMALSGLTFEGTEGLPSERSQTQPSSINGILLMPVRFQTSGNYQQIQSLLRSFELQERFMRTSVLEINRTDSGQIEASFTLEVFLKP